MTYREEILDGTVTSEMTLPYFYGWIRAVVCFTITIFIFDWRIKALFLFGMHVIHILLLHDLTEPSFYMLMVKTFLAVLLICFLFRSMSQTLNAYLEILQGKFEDDQNWKMLVEELSNGIAIFRTKSNELIYFNEMLGKLFGCEKLPTVLKNTKVVIEEETDRSFMVKELKLYETQLLKESGKLISMKKKPSFNEALFKNRKFETIS